jgi:hypothetical protein
MREACDGMISIDYLENRVETLCRVIERELFRGNVLPEPRRSRTRVGVSSVSDAHYGMSS